METSALTFVGPLTASHSEAGRIAYSAHKPPVRIMKPIAEITPDSSAMGTVNERSFSDEELFQKFIFGDVAAFTILFERHNSRVFYYCAKIVRDAEAAEDITQTMWERVIEMRASTELSHSSVVRNVPGLLFRIARNLALDYLKHHQMQSPLDSATESLRSSDNISFVGDELSEREQIMLECLDALPLTSREILVLHYYSGYSFDEIAGMLGKKPNAIWTRASRARAALKASIEKRLLSVATQRDH